MEQAVTLQAQLATTSIESRRVLNDLTVIIPTVGRPILQRCLQSIADGTVLPARIIAIDQGDNLEVAHWLRRIEAMGLNTLHLRSAERSPASARNRGIEQVQTRYVAAIDDDCIAEKDWLEKMEMRLHQNPSSIITGRLEAAGDGIPPSIVTSIQPRLQTRPSLRIASFLATANMGFALRTAQHIGQFDGNVSPAEDIDWGYRALHSGVPILYAPEIVVYHVHWRDESQLTTVYRMYAWSYGTFCGKHLRRGDWSILLRTIIYLQRGVRSWINGIVHPDVRERATGYACMAYFLPGLAAGLRGLGTSHFYVNTKTTSSNHS